MHLTSARVDCGSSIKARLDLLQHAAQTQTARLEHARAPDPKRTFAGHSAARGRELRQHPARPRLRGHRVRGGGGGGPVRGPVRARAGLGGSGRRRHRARVAAEKVCEHALSNFFTGSQHDRNACGSGA